MLMSSLSLSLFVQLEGMIMNNKGRHECIASCLLPRARRQIAFSFLFCVLRLRPPIVENQQEGDEIEGATNKKKRGEGRARERAWAGVGQTATYDPRKAGEMGDVR
jgi:hypothetical protein